MKRIHIQLQQVEAERIDEIKRSSGKLTRTSAVNYAIGLTLELLKAKERGAKVVLVYEDEASDNEVLII